MAKARRSRRRPFKRFISGTGDLLLAGFAFFFLGIFKLIGVEAASWTAGKIARTLGPWVKTPHRRGIENMKRVLGVSEDEAQKLMRGVWETFGRMAGEYPHLRVFANKANGRLTLAGQQFTDEAYYRGNGLIGVSGHFCNLELFGVVYARENIPALGVARHVNNPYLQAYAERKRRSIGYGAIVGKGAQATREMVRILKEKGFLGMLVDQKLAQGVVVPFFGIPCMTPDGAAALHLRTGAPLMPAVMTRGKGARYTITAYPEITYEPTGDRDADIVAIMTQINDFLEARIRERPHEWLWMHRRWPSPEESVALAAKAEAQAAERARNRALSQASEAPPVEDPGAPGTS